MRIPSWSQSCHELLGWLAASFVDVSRRGIKVLLDFCVTQFDTYQTWTEGVISLVAHGMFVDYMC
jgi:hypothetical protein